MRKQLRKLRKVKGLTQQSTAHMLGISRSFYAEIETGRRRPTVPLALRIAELFGASVEALFSGLDGRDSRLNEARPDKTAAAGQ